MRELRENQRRRDAGSAIEGLDRLIITIHPALDPKPDQCDEIGHPGIHAASVLASCPRPNVSTGEVKLSRMTLPSPHVNALLLLLLLLLPTSTGVPTSFPPSSSSSSPGQLARPSWSPSRRL